MKQNKIKGTYYFLKPRAITTVIAAALFCTLATKFYWAVHIGKLGQYAGWITADIAVLTGVELIAVLICFLWQKKWAFRISLTFAAFICTWSVFNAGWLIATGTQVIPAVLLPLIFDPVSRFAIVGHHLAARPLVAIALLAPSAVALAFFFKVIHNPPALILSKKQIQVRLVIFLAMLIVCGGIGKLWQINDKHSTFAELRYNSQLKAFKSIFLTIRRENNQRQRQLKQMARRLPSNDANAPTLKTKKYAGEYNIVIVVLEGVCPKQTELFEPNTADVPFLSKMSRQSAFFTNCRTAATHTTKALTAIHTGQYPSTSQDYIEAAVQTQPYQSIASILKNYGYKTGFFQSADGKFECRPGLAYNLGFDYFFARQNIKDANSYLGYLAADEFQLLEPIENWLGKSEKPFLLSIMLSATHDPYELPEEFQTPDYKQIKEPVEKYRRLITYTDTFLQSLYNKLSLCCNIEKTIFCVVGDHGEAFGQHGRYGHARIPYDEALKVFWLLNCPKLIKPLQINTAVSNLDVMPTILSLLGFEIPENTFAGVNALNENMPQRDLFFSTWVAFGEAGFIRDKSKYIYDRTNKLLTVYDLTADANENNGLSMPEKSPNAVQFVEKIQNWQDSMFIGLDENGKEEYQRIFDSWLCQTNSIEPKAVYNEQ